MQKWRLNIYDSFIEVGKPMDIRSRADQGTDGWSTHPIADVQTLSTARVIDADISIVRRTIM